MRTIATVAHRLNARNAQKETVLPALLALTDTRRNPDPSDVLPLLPKSSAVIYRNGDHPQRFILGEKIRLACWDCSIPFIWAGTAAEGMDMAADGLHLRDDPVHRAREISIWRRRCDGPVFAAAHSPRAVRQCAALGVDAVLLSPVFATRSHPGAKYLGITRFRQWSRQSSVPVYGLGGVTDATAQHLLDTRSVGIAGIDWCLNL